MKITSKVLFTIALTLCLSLVSFAQNAWTGEYFFGEDGGETAGGSKIYIAHTITITEKDSKLDAHIYSQGFQTSRDIYADVKTEGNKIMFYFREKGEDQYTSNYEKGDLLLTLEKKTVDGKEKILTYWNAFTPVIESNEKSGEVYFEKSQEKKSEISEWKLFETENKELSFSLPSNFIYSEDEGFTTSKDNNPRQKIKFSNLRSITGFENNVSMWVESYEVENGIDAFRYFPFHFNYSSAKTKDYGIGQNFLREIAVDDNHYAKYFYFNSDKKFYIVGFGTKYKNNPTIQKFLQSVKFNGKYILLAEEPKISESKSLDNKNLNIMEKQKISPLDVSYEYFSPTIKQTSYVNSSEQNSPIVILTYPKPGYTDEAREKDEIGEVRVKILFAKDGLVRKVIVAKGLKYGLTEKAVNATRRLRYLPAEDNGNPVSQVKTVVFNFSIY